MSISKPFFAVPLLMAVLVLSLATGGEAAAVFGVGLPVIQFLKGLYLQQLSSGPGSSCMTNDPNNPACHHGH
ncbi:hypothetical protein PVAP13_1KG033965 [Panicum virgatum]|uniref:Transmembrane protein n=1 Tax=Panicum virgatum TaxID=38727 RepID=A0A8T0XNE1_PANVG|nr:hypothetical protein PVAP13_1KG503500 [Panicum virgatum]KAG2661413.1 hypothetical protein PVAP13_1KG033930 [Panicum virgatum]KAG2661420.1 hypothetical protein PVAP13_1KG033965 [Panicum virgatum]